MNQHEREAIEEIKELRHLSERLDRHISVFIEIDSEGADVESKELRISKATTDVIKATALLEYYATLLSKSNNTK